MNDEPKEGRGKEPVEFRHPPLGELVESVSGSYSIDSREVLDFEGRQVLYFLGTGVVDKSCCGVGGVSYAMVPGYLVEMECEKSEDGALVSLVEPITDDAEKQRIRTVLMKLHPIGQVNFP